MRPGWPGSAARHTAAECVACPLHAAAQRLAPARDQHRVCQRVPWAAPPAVWAPLGPASKPASRLARSTTGLDLDPACVPSVCHHRHRGPTGCVVSLVTAQGVPWRSIVGAVAVVEAGAAQGGARNWTCPVRQAWSQNWTDCRAHHQPPRSYRPCCCHLELLSMLPAPPPAPGLCRGPSCRASRSATPRSERQRIGPAWNHVPHCASASLSSWWGQQR